jgi:hypothetical protein
MFITTQNLSFGKAAHGVAPYCGISALAIQGGLCLGLFAPSFASIDGECGQSLRPTSLNWALVRHNKVRQQ